MSSRSAFRTAFPWADQPTRDLEPVAFPDAGGYRKAPLSPGGLANEAHSDRVLHRDAAQGAHHKVYLGTHDIRHLFATHTALVPPVRGVG
jgi:hypothetical protein